IEVADQGSGATGPGMDSQALSIIVLDTFAYAAGSGTATVEVINTDTNVFVTSIAVGGGRSFDQVAVTRNGRYVYVTSPNTDEVTVIDATTNTVVTTIDVSVDCSTPRGVDTTDLVGIGPRAYVACEASNAVIAIDADDTSGTFNTVVATIATVGSATGTPQRIAFTPDGTKAYVTVTTTNEFSAIDAATDTVTATDPFTNFGCSNPMGVVVLPDGTKAFVACRSNRKLVRIDVATDADDAQTTTQLGTTGASSPDSLAVTPAGDRLYVTLSSGGAGLPEFSIVTVSDLSVQGEGTTGLGVPFLDGTGPEGGVDANTLPSGVTIPPGTLIEIFMVMMGDASGNDAPNTQFAPGTAVFNDGPPVAEGTNNSITFATGTLPRGIAHIPIPR
ncbi:MAG TPA: YncE family protein, partial [Candidatus Acidoferrales bacterium]